MNSAARAVFLDRDGVINRRPPEGLYITSPDEFVLLPGVAGAIIRLNESGFLVIVATNQRCIARGIVAADVVNVIHERMLQEVVASGGRIDRVYLCPHDYADACECRKPKPGMLRRAALEYALDLPDCWMVGDSASDIEAGRGAGCRTVFVGGAVGVAADFVAADLCEAVEQILKQS
jgi:D-glycero-D-manno-heptose 1,7-bisphosphate phosphatase